ncbi:MAG TPA: glycosyltransferase family 4 protein [Solirubrobacteraceae bacterium]|jgi:glycosyltransferase involved in cell wall biosynthesis|nr:glycosyltransferase family 4 protein [Solirubrobacteraceae bacterium]
MVLFLHNRYRVPGGEERVVEELTWLVRERIGEPAELLARGAPPTANGAPRGEGGVSVAGRARAAAGLLRGGLDPGEVGDAVRRTGARVVHAHNLNPAFGWRALAAARAAGARVVVHLHQYRLVCAVGVCFTRGEECTRCHGRNTLPGIARNCRGSRAEALAYGAGLALWQPRLVEQADAVIVPSAFARERLRALGAPLPWERVHVLAPPVRALEQEAPATRGAPGGYALMVGRVSPEKGLEVAIEACGLAGIPLVVAGTGFDERALATVLHRADVSFVGRVDDARLAELRAGAALALVPSRSAETFGLAAAEAMAAGLPVVGSRVGALGELLEERALAPPGDARALAAAIERMRADPAAGARARERIAALCAPVRVAQRLAAIYDGASA